MKVKLLAYTPEPEKVVAIAARLCYSNKADIDTIAEGFTEEEIKKFVSELIATGHHSTLEHVSFTFGIEDVSRVLTHELVRHRIASYSQRSQRYCSEGECNFLLPNNISNGETIKIYDDTYDNIKDTYNSLIKEGIAKEDARYILPNGTATRIIVTMNARSLLHFFALRCCTRAQLEIRQLANEMLKLVKSVAPILFMKGGPSCDQMGYCPEGNRCCGKAPTLQKLLKNYELTTNK